MTILNLLIVLSAMLKIRFSKVGRKHEPVYRLVLTDKRNAAKSGKFNEILGSYDSRRSDKAEFKGDRVKHWLSHGAKLSDTAHNLLVKLGVIEGVKRNVLKKSVIESAKAKKIERDTPKVEEKVEEIEAPETATEPVETAPEVPSESVAEAAHETPSEVTPEVAQEDTPATINTGETNA